MDKTLVANVAATTTTTAANKKMRFTIPPPSYYSGILARSGACLVSLLVAARGLIGAPNRERLAPTVELELVGFGVGLENVQGGASYVLNLELVGLGIVLKEVYAALNGSSVADALDPCALVGAVTTAGNLEGLIDLSTLSLSLGVLGDLLPHTLLEL